MDLTWRRFSASQAKSQSIGYNSSQMENEHPEEAEQEAISYTGNMLQFMELQLLRMERQSSL